MGMHTHNTKNMTPLFAFFATLFFVGCLGVVLGYLLKTLLALRKKEGIESKIARMEQDARVKASEIITSAEKQSQETRKQTKEDFLIQKQELQDSQKRIHKKEEYLDVREQDLNKEREIIATQKEDLHELFLEQKKKLEGIAHISEKDAKEMLFKRIEEDERETFLARMRKLEQETEESVSTRAKDMLVSAIHRYGNSVENDIMSTSVKLPDDDTKGKIIGKEGRNIKAFEKTSGVQLIIDDTPGIITISSFDPVRRAIAKKALETLIKDGRIQPARIETVVKESKANVKTLISEKGREAAIDCGIADLSPDLLQTLGKLYFRYSYGQNVLQHSVEMAHLAGTLADQVGADTYVAKAGALLHDIGKAEDHAVEGSHVDIGRRILRKEGISEEVIKAMQSHHEEYPYENIESILVQVADAISGGRPGARSDIANMYIKKLDGLERISQSIPGVESAYALSAGREIRVFVNPEEVDDYQAKKIAREVAKQIEQELKYPGEIKVHVIRESRIIDYAR